MSDKCPRSMTKMMNIYYNNDKELKDALEGVDEVSISINSFHVTEARNTKTIREQVLNMMAVRDMDCVAMSILDVRDAGYAERNNLKVGHRYAQFWFATDGNCTDVVDNVKQFYGNNLGGYRVAYFSNPCKQ